MTLNQAWQIGGFALAMLCCAWAFWRGGPVERRGAVYIFVAWTLSVLFQSHAKTGPGIWVTLIDIILLGLLVHLSIQSRQLWTLFVAACQLDAVASHFSQAFIHYSQWVYVMVLGIWGGYGLLICLVAGTIGYQLERRKQTKAGVKPNQFP